MAIREIVWAREGTHLWAVGDNALVQVDVALHTVSQRLPTSELEASHPFSSVALHPTEERLALLRQDEISEASWSTLLLVDPRIPVASLVASLPLPGVTGGPTTSIAWSSDGQFVLVRGNQSYVLDGQTAHLLAELPRLDFEATPTDLLVYAQALKHVGWRDEVDLFWPYRVTIQPTTGTVASIVTQPNVFVHEPRSPDGTQVVANTTDSTILVLDLATGATRATLPNPFAERSNQTPHLVRWREDGLVFALASFGHEVALCTVADEACITVQGNLNSFVDDMAWQPGGRLLGLGMFQDLVLLDLSDALAELGQDVAD